MQDEALNEEAGSFPALFSREDFKNDIRKTMLVLANQANFAFMSGTSITSLAESHRRVWSLLSTTEHDSYSFLSDTDIGPDEVGLTFQDIEHIATVQDLLAMYDYGVHGIWDNSTCDFNTCDGFANWMARILYDLSKSTFLQEWSSYAGDHVSKSVENCVYVCELANARLILEGCDDSFFIEDRRTGELYIRQMALVSGMSEATIRTLASRKSGKNKLIAENRNGSTTIEIEHAKEWLKAKGRYVNITTVRTSGSEDFTTRKYVTFDDFEEAFLKRVNYLRDVKGISDIYERVLETGIKFLTVPIKGTSITQQVIDVETMLDTSIAQRLGEVLELPPVQFALRAAEAIVQDKLRAIERQLKAAASV
jgi:hypothetical protein